MDITIRHRLRIAVGEGAPRAVMHLLLTPQSSTIQTVREWRLDVPGLDDAAGFVDAFGNRAHLATQTRPEAELTITASGTVVTIDRHGVVGRLDRDPVPALFTRTTALTRPIGAITSKFRSVPAAGSERIAVLHALMARVAEVVGGDMQSQSEAADGQSQSQSQGGGKRPDPAAADHAHAFIGAARALDFPARYVTGYLAAEGDEAAAFHAWAEAWDEGLGWIGFDPMLGLCPTERHVRVACGLDASSAQPVRAVPMAGQPQSISVEISGG